MVAGDAAVPVPGKKSSTSSSSTVTSAPHTSPITIVRATAPVVPPEPGPTRAATPAGTASARLRTACQALTGVAEAPKQRQAVA